MHPMTLYEIAVREHDQATEHRALARLHARRLRDRTAPADGRTSDRVTSRDTSKARDKRANR